MTIPITNVSFLDLQTEFGGSNPISLNEYYAGGVNVVNPGPTSANQIGIIPVSGAISIGNFLGVSNGFTYFSSGNDLTSWSRSAENGGPQDNTHTMQFNLSNIGNPATSGDFIVLQSKSLVATITRSLPFTTYNHFYIEYKTMFHPVFNGRLLCLLGGTQSGLQINYLGGVTIGTNVGSSIFGTTLRNNGGSIDNIWIKVALSGTRTTGTTFSVNTVITDLSSNGVLVNATTNVNNIAADTLQFLYFDTDSGDTSLSGVSLYLDYIQFRAY